MKDPLACFCDGCLGSTIPGVLALHPDATFSRRANNTLVGEKCTMCGMKTKFLTAVREVSVEPLCSLGRIPEKEVTT